ncbi:MAG: hypothetical protein QM655_14795 [Nocardioidaceae bacterium]
MPTPDNNPDPEVDKNAPYRSSRRAAHQGRVKSKSTRRSPRRRIIVHSELRDEPDVRKIARAIISMAMLEAEREARAQAQAQADQPGDGDAEVSADE